MYLFASASTALEESQKGHDNRTAWVAGSATQQPVLESRLITKVYRVCSTCAQLLEARHSEGDATNAKSAGSSSPKPFQCRSRRHDSEQHERRECCGTRGESRRTEEFRHVSVGLRKPTFPFNIISAPQMGGYLVQHRFREAHALCQLVCGANLQRHRGQGNIGHLGTHKLQLILLQDGVPRSPALLRLAWIYERPKKLCLCTI